MDGTTRQGDEKLIHVVGLNSGQKVYSVALRGRQKGDVKNKIGWMEDRTAPYYVQY